MKSLILWCGILGGLGLLALLNLDCSSSVAAPPKESLTLAVECDVMARLALVDGGACSERYARIQTLAKAAPQCAAYYPSADPCAKDGGGQ